jgi:hypothetical protein
MAGKSGSPDPEPSDLASEITVEIQRRRESTSTG